jgi:hypothetical protein
VSIRNPFHPIAFEEPITAEKIRRLEDLIKLAFGDISQQVNTQVTFVTPGGGTGGTGGAPPPDGCCAAVLNIAALRALPAGGMKPGARCWVNSKVSVYILDQTAPSTVIADTADGTRGDIVVTANHGSPFGFWYRSFEPSPLYQAHAVNYDPATDTGGLWVDPANTTGVASDENIGLSRAFPFRSMIEVWARLAGGDFDKSHFVTVRLISDITDDDDNQTDVVRFFANAVQIIGDEIPIEGGESITLTAATDLNVGVDLGRLSTAAFDFISFLSDNSRTI